MTISELVRVLLETRERIGDVSIDVMNGAGDFDDAASVDVVNVSLTIGVVRLHVRVTP